MKFLSSTDGFSIVIPAYNEAGALAETLASLQRALADLTTKVEVIVVDDGSVDGTSAAVTGKNVRILKHPINCGYGRSLLTGIEAALYDTIVIMDADGTYPAAELPSLLAFYDRGFHMAVGARQGKHYQSSVGKRLLRMLFRFLAEFTCGRDIPDINSGFRIFDRRPVLRWRDSMSTGFSFTTTITLLFMLNNLLVGYMPISYSKRVGQSKVRLFRDSFRSLQIIITTIAQFNPLKLFLLLGIINLAGNFCLWACVLQWEWSSILVWIWLLAWNTSAAIASASIIALGLIKPVGAHAHQLPNA